MLKKIVPCEVVETDDMENAIENTNYIMIILYLNIIIILFNNI